MGLKEVMMDTNKKLSDNLYKCVTENELDYSNSKLYLDIISDFKTTIGDLECSKIMEEVIYDLLTSMYFVSFGLYRNAYVSLRSALELGIGFIYFVDRNYNYLLWKNDLYDIKWCDLTNEDNGVINEKYLSLFISAEYGSLINNIKMVYRECSEYVHGKYSYMQTLEKISISYDIDKFKEWNEMFNNISQVLIVLLFIRFSNKIEEIDEDNIITLQEVLNRYNLREVIIKNEK